MREAIVLAIAFVLTLMLATTLVPSLPAPYVYAPIMLASGLLVMHRAGSVIGGTWVLLGGVLVGGPGAFWFAAIAAIVGGVLAERVFAARSAYALLGLGLSTGIIMLAVRTLSAVGGSIAGTGIHIGDVFAVACWQLLLLLVLVYTGFVLLHVTRRTLTTLFVIR